MKICSVIFLILVCNFKIHANEADSIKLENFINETLIQGYEILQGNLPEEELKYSVEQLVIQIFDLEWLTKFLLGAKIKKESSLTIEEFKKEYLKYLVSIYYKYALSYRGEKLQILNIHKIQDDFFAVETSLAQKNNDLLKIEYLLKRNGNTYKVLDIKTENVSLVYTHKSEFANFLHSKSLSELVMKMKKHNASK